MQTDSLVMQASCFQQGANKRCRISIPEEWNTESFVSATVGALGACKQLLTVNHLLKPLVLIWACN